MPRLCIALLTWAVAASSAAATAQDRPDASADPEGPPAVVVSPRGDAAAFVRRRAGPAAVDERWLLELGGRRINARNSTPWPAPGIDGITLVRLADGAAHQILAPFETSLGWVRFAPDGSHLSWVVVRDTGSEQWVVDVATGVPRPLTSASLNAAWGEPCAWLGDASGVLCRFRRSARGTPPDAADALFEYHFTSQLGTVELATGRRTDVGSPGLFAQAAPAPNGAFILTANIGAPPAGAGPARVRSRAIEIRDVDGNLVRRLIDALAGVAPHWHPAAPATVVWSTPRAAGGARVLRLAAPFDGAPETLMRTAQPIAAVAWTERGSLLVTESDAHTGHERTWLLGAGGTTPRTLLDWRPGAEMERPGRPVRRPGGPAAGSPVMQADGRILLRGGGGRFLDRLDLTTLRTERLFEGGGADAEVLVAPLAADGSVLLTRRAGGYFVRDTAAGTLQPLPAGGQGGR